MTLQDLKSQIISHEITDELIIFKDSEGFISYQYINAIAKERKLELKYLDSPKELVADTWSIFSSDIGDAETALNVIHSDIYMWDDIDISLLKNTIIVVSKFQTKTVEKQLANYIVSVPKIEDWMWRDYVHSIAEGVSTKDLDWLIRICPSRFRLENELDKIRLFRKEEQKYLFTELVQDGTYSDLSSFTIFNFTNAITSKDKEGLKNVYREIDSVDINEFGLLIILIKNFRNILMVQLNSNPTEENTGLDRKQLYAIKKLPKVYTSEQLIKIYQFLLDIDRQVKSGELPTELMIDYLVIKILSM